MAVTSLRSATNAPSGRPTNPTRALNYPKRVRILRSADFRQVYERGWRFSCPIFTAFCLASDDPGEARFGYTLPRAVGKANVRNRIRRRIREKVRLMRDRFPSGMQIVLNPRRSAYDASQDEIGHHLDRLLARCVR